MTIILFFTNQPLVRKNTILHWLRLLLVLSTILVPDIIILALILIIDQDFTSSPDSTEQDRTGNQMAQIQTVWLQRLK